ncbi:type VI secretion system-associated FHA domain protein TagH [Vibrio rhizosphaerae]|nr:type VI secretion system-associated FHA domain protein TagH [Vibrio rhizosphaerae]
MVQSKQPSLNIIVTNVQVLESGLTSRTTWTPAGGTIGTAADSFWLLTDKNGAISPNHCEIQVVDGAFCVRDNCGETYVNGSSMPLGRNKLARLENKDEIQVGPYSLRVHLGNNGEDDIASSNVLEQLFDDDRHSLLADDDGEAATLHRSDEVDHSVIDPLMALDELSPQNKDDSNVLIDGDEEEARAEEEAQEQPLLAAEEYYQRPLQETQQENGEYDMTASISLKKIFRFGALKLGRKSKSDVAQAAPANTRSSSTVNHSTVNHSTTRSNNTDAPDNQSVHNRSVSHGSVDYQSENNESEGYGMDENVLDLLEEEVAKSMSSTSEQSVGTNHHGKHLLTGPMLDGLGVDLTDSHDMEKMHFLSEELGLSLQACVKGLLDLHKQVNHGRFDMMNRNLQPIEDNPLRLGLSYEETMKTMYDSQKSLVHLSAPAAITESLKSIQDHNEAVQYATTEALSQILAAFSPQVLLRRFNNYKRPNEQRSDSEDAWAWNMYSSYYQELTSNRQKGFEKLFWEIFEQAYDKKIREKQLEF